MGIERVGAFKATCDVKGTPQCRDGMSVSLYGLNQTIEALIQAGWDIRTEGRHHTMFCPGCVALRAPKYVTKDAVTAPPVKTRDDEKRERRRIRQKNRRKAAKAAKALQAVK